jgi:hypothetical protein
VSRCFEYDNRESDKALEQTYEFTARMSVLDILAKENCGNRTGDLEMWAVLNVDHRVSLDGRSNRNAEVSVDSIYMALQLRECLQRRL